MKKQNHQIARRGIQSIVLVIGLMMITPGCSICCQPYLDDYVAFGSRTPRSDMKYGRVGSPFSDPNGVAGFVANQPEEAYNHEGGELEYYDEAIVEESEGIELMPGM